MKVINNSENKDFPILVKCEDCSTSVLIEGYDDLAIGPYGVYCWDCPCCGKTNIVKELDIAPLTIDDLEFPTHFCYCDETHSTDKEITTVIKSLVAKVATQDKDDNVGYIMGSDYFIFVKRDTTIGGYSIVVCKNPYDGCVDYGDKDYA